MATPELLQVALDEALPMSRIPVVHAQELGTLITDAIASGCRLAALFGWPQRKATHLAVVLADPATGKTRVAITPLADRWQALTPRCPQAHLFERELAEQCGLQIDGHPWLKPLRFSEAGRTTGGTAKQVGVMDFFRVDGDEVHEVAVGPVHAGVIEPGHFRFQCHGETVLHLEISRGYQHRGVEPSLAGGPGPRTIHTMETLAGDTSVGHASTYCQVAEALAGHRVPVRGLFLRGMALELERLANHVGDLGALSGDIGYLPTASFCGRIRGDILNMTAALCGSRLGRGLVRPGGSAFDVDDALVDDLRRRLDTIDSDLRAAVSLLWNTPNARARFEQVGVLSADDCRALGIVGPVARASGLAIDARAEFPTGVFTSAHIPVATVGSGDVFARAQLRWLEAQHTIAFLRETLCNLPDGAVREDVPAKLADNAMAISCTEGWRGEIWHVAITDSSGRFLRYKVVDPSFHNWIGLALAMRGQVISDFPVCNKSFNLSYCGVDL